jgi:hypothetical protein
VAGDDGGDCGASVFVTHTSAFSRRIAPELCLYPSPQKRARRYPERGAGATPRGERGMPGAGCTRSRVREV